MSKIVWGRYIHKTSKSHLFIKKGNGWMAFCSDEGWKNIKILPRYSMRAAAENEICKRCNGFYLDIEILTMV